MSSHELAEHAGYFRDRRKLQAYELALSRLVHPGDVVIDLGSGTGLLGLLAARAGAKRIYMIDSGPILGAALEVVARNGFAECVVPVRGASTDVALPEQADLVLCDQIGGFVYDAGVLRFFADAKERLLKPGGHLVPASFTLQVAPVCAPGPRDKVDLWARRPADLETEPLHRLAINSEWRIDAAEATIVAAPATVGRIASSSVERLVNTMTFEFEDAATVDGLLGWFDAELAPGVHLTNMPHAADRMQRWCNFYPLARSIEVASGDRLEATVDLRPDPGIVTWSVTWFGTDERLGHWRQSTLLGQFLGPEDLLNAANGRVLHPTPASAAIADALHRLDGQRPTESIIDAVIDDHPTAFVSPSRGRQVLRDQLTKWTRTPS